MVGVAAVEEESTQRGKATQHQGKSAKVVGEES